MSNKLLCFAGSSRSKSLNMQLARQANEIAQGMGATSTFIDLSDYPMPIYQGDDEAENGLPPAALELQTLFREHDAFLIASPEYNSSFSALLKNTLDWISRSNPNNSDEENAALPSPFQGKVAGLVAASPGGFGGLRGLTPLRLLLGNIGVLVIPQQLAVAGAFGKIDSDGRFVDEGTLKGLNGIVAAALSASV